MKRNYWIPVLFLVLMASGCAHCSMPAQETKDHDRYLISLPPVTLGNEPPERIDMIRVVMHCGRFIGIHKIPNDWSVRMVSPMSEETTLTMDAGHGNSSLWSIEKFADFATILNVSHDCFDISASVHVFSYDGQERERTIEIRQQDIIMKKLPNQPL